MISKESSATPPLKDHSEQLPESGGSYRCWGKASLWNCGLKRTTAIVSSAWRPHREEPLSAAAHLISGARGQGMW